MKTKQSLVCGLFAVLLTLAGAGMVFAQEEAKTETEEVAVPKVKKNAVTIDAIPLFKGFIASDIREGEDNPLTFFFCMAFAYERLIIPHFTIGADLDLYPGTVENCGYMYFGMAANGRYYPMSEYMEKLYLGASLGFNRESVNLSDDALDSDASVTVGLTVGLEAGYKLFFGKMFFVEPSMSYTYSKTSFGLFGSTPLNIGWQAGLRAGVAF